MAGRRYVKEDSNGDWEVVKEGHRRATARETTKQKAITAARGLVRDEGGGEVQVINRTGKIVEIDRVPRQRKRAAA